MQKIEDLPITNPLFQYIEQEIINIHRGTNYKKIIEKSLLTSLGAIAGVPFANPAYKAASGNPILGGFFAGGTIVAYGAGAIWILHNIYDELNQSSIKKTLLDRSKLHTRTKYIISTLLGITISSVPIYTVFKQNEIGWFALITIPISIAFNFYGYYTLIDTISLDKIKVFLTSYCSKSDYFKISNKSTLTKYTIDYLTSFINSDATYLSEIYDRLITSSTSGRHFIAKLLQHSVDNNDISNVWTNGRPRALLQFLFMVFPISNAVVNAKLAREAATLLSDNIFFGISFVILTIPPSLIIDSIVTTITTGNIYDVVVNKIFKKPSYDYISAHYFKLNSISIAVAVIFAILSSSSRAFIANDTINNDTSWFFMLSAISSSIIFESFALKDLFNKILMKLISKTGNPNAKLALDMQERLLEFASTINRVDSKTIDLWLEADMQLENEALLTKSSDANFENSSFGMEENTTEADFSQNIFYNFYVYTKRLTLFNQPSNRPVTENIEQSPKYKFCTLV